MDTPRHRPSPDRPSSHAAVLPVAPAVPAAVIVPEALHASAGLYLWPRLRLPPGALCVYVLTVLRPPEAPGRPVRSEAVYVGKTADLLRRLAYHAGRSGSKPRGRRNPQGYLPAWDDCLYYIEEADEAGVLEVALIKTLHPMGNRQHRDEPLSHRERTSLERWGIALPRH